MAGAALQRRLTWRVGEVVEVVDETPRTRSVVMSVAGWPGHQAGQHVDVRLTAADGYQAQRSYSIASPPEAGERVTLTVERIDDGEVSPFLAGELRAGDRIELRGPIGGYFVWDIAQGGPVLLVAGGSGICPLMAMLRHRTAQRSAIPMRLLYSSRSLEDVIYREELDRLGDARTGLEVVHTLTRAQPAGWSGFSRRIDRSMLFQVA
jgi:ferredoxin-NADP reductase